MSLPLSCFLLTLVLIGCKAALTDFNSVSGTSVLYGSTSVLQFSTPYLFIFGGSGVINGLPSSNAIRYDISLKNYTIIATHPRPASYSIGVLWGLNSAIIYGGTDFQTSVYSGGYLYTFATNTLTVMSESTSNKPPASHSASGTVIYTGGLPYFVVFGGCSDVYPSPPLTVFNDLRISDQSFTWKLLSPLYNTTNLPSARMGASMVAFDSTQINPSIPDCLLLSGGSDVNGNVLTDLWKTCPLYSASNVTWIKLTSLSTASMYHQALIVNQRMLVSGGYTGQYPLDYLDSLLEYNIALNSWNNVNVVTPSGRSSHIFASYNTSLIILGGQDRYSTRNDSYLSSYQPLLCSPGNVFDSTGKICSTCSTGKYSNIYGAYSCSLCPSGSFQNVTGQTLCVQCSPGTYNSNNGSTLASACQSCALNTYNPNTGSNSSSACLPCGANLVTTSIGAISCSSCVTLNTFAINGTCQTCPVGTYYNVIGSTSPTSCTSCPVGNYCVNGTKIACSTGYYSSSTGAASCKLCSSPSLSFYVTSLCTASSDTGVTTCTPPLALSTYVTSLCLGGNANLFGTNTLTSTCTKPSNGQYIAINCQPGNATSSLGTNSIIQSCSTPIIKSNQFYSTICSNATLTLNGNNVLVSNCSVPLASLGQYVVTVCQPGSLSIPGSDTVISSIWNGWIKNGNFSNGFTDWTLISGNYSINTVNRTSLALPITLSSVSNSTVNTTSSVTLSRSIISQSISINFINRLPFILSTYVKTLNFVTSSNINSSSSLSIYLNSLYSNGSTVNNDLSMSFPNGTYDYTQFTGYYLPTSGVQNLTLGLSFISSTNATVYFTGLSLYISTQITSLCSQGTYLNILSTGNATTSSSSSKTIIYNGMNLSYECIVCPPGSYCSLGAQIACGINTYSFANAFICNVCPSNWVCKNGIGVPCAGTGNRISTSFYNATSYQCQKCPAGYSCYSGSLSKCPDGSISAQGDGFCKLCYPGSYSNSDQTSCLVCGNGFHSNYGRNYCESCPFGMTSQNGSSCL